MVAARVDRADLRDNTRRRGRPQCHGRRANGTYRDGKSEIKILSVGRGKLKVELNIVAPRDEGSASGEATIENDVAIFVPPETDGCKLTMTFLPDGKLKVEQEGRPVDCRFGRMAPAEGTYKKVSSAKPKFSDT